MQYILGRKTSIKDLVESFGVPHTEVDYLVVNGTNMVDFGYIVMPEDSIEIYPVSRHTNFFTSTPSRQALCEGFKFICDVNVGKLARWLRLLGFDTLYENDFDDHDLAELAFKTRRIVLSKDCNLLKRKKIVWGHLVRVDDVLKQVAGVVRLYRLEELIQPYTRCLRCNGVLVKVSKKKIDHMLEPLTRKYYNDFYQCDGCHQVYWQGSHRPAMQMDLQKLLKMCREGDPVNSA